jgi:hypothetical protein
VVAVRLVLPFLCAGRLLDGQAARKSARFGGDWLGGAR